MLVRTFLLHNTLPLLFELQNSNCPINHSHSLNNFIILNFTHIFSLCSTLSFSKASSLSRIVSQIKVENVLMPVQEKVTLLESGNEKLPIFLLTSTPLLQTGVWSRISSNVMKLSTGRLKSSFITSPAMCTQNLHPTHNL